MKVKVRVTQEDIDWGCRCNPNHCPIARSATRLLKEDLLPMSFSIGVDDFCVNNDGIPRKTPRAAAKFIVAFDAYGTGAVEPCTFTIDIPRKYLKCPPKKKASRS